MLLPWDAPFIHGPLDGKAVAKVTRGAFNGTLAVMEQIILGGAATDRNYNLHKLQISARGEDIPELKIPESTRNAEKWKLQNL